MSPGLSVEELVVGYGDGDGTVLEGVSLTVDRGELVGLVGPNGAGKTTLVRTLLGALEPDGGRALLDGDPVMELSSREAARRVAAVPQRAGFTFPFTVREVVEMGRHPHSPRLGRDPDPDRVGAALERAEVAGLADRSVDAVSGGERQRVLIARALAQDTPALVLDEPTASLDVNHQVRTLELVRELADDGHAVLAAIHDLNLAARFCDRLVLLAGGEVAAAGPPDRVLDPDVLGAAFGARAVVGRDPLTDSPVVTALPDRTADRAATVHVVGSGPAAASVLGTLAEAGFETTAGVAPAGGRVAALADRLGIKAVTAPPFADAASDARDRASGLVEAADVTVLVPSGAVGRGPNAGLTTTAARVVVAGEGSGARALAERRTRSRAVPPADVVAGVTAALTERPRPEGTDTGTGATADADAGTGHGT